MRQRWELERLEEERRQMAALRRKTELGCVREPGVFPAGWASCLLRLPWGPLRPKGDMACGEVWPVGVWPAGVWPAGSSC